jgi:hypothetical protein
MLTDQQISGLNDLYRSTPTKAARKLIRGILKMPAARGYMGVDLLARRATVAARIAELAENGQLAILSGGRDCDGYEVRGEVTVLPAAVVAYERWLGRFCDGAEGPIWHNLDRPSVAVDVERTTRDVYAEVAGY